MAEPYRHVRKPEASLAPDDRILPRPQHSMIAFASAIEPLRMADRMSGETLYHWVLIHMRHRDLGSRHRSSGRNEGNYYFVPQPHNPD
jgi:hypothetical protein